MFIDRRTFVKGAAAATVAPQVLVRSARGQDKNKVVFVSEESNPKAIAVYEKINADFKKETGIDVVV
ncbi:MAG TPA: twin-arginine translocation signal domain-containing protein, partial [Methylomirabilota bacterium]